MPNSWDGKVIATHSSINFLVQSTILQHCSVFSRPCCVVVVVYSALAMAAAAWGLFQPRVAWKHLYNLNLISTKEYSTLHKKIDTRMCCNDFPKPWIWHKQLLTCSDQLPTVICSESQNVVRFFLKSKWRMFVCLMFDLGCIVQSFLLFWNSDALGLIRFFLEYQFSASSTNHNAAHLRRAFWLVDHTESLCIRDSTLEPRVNIGV